VVTAGGGHLTKLDSGIRIHVWAAQDEDPEDFYGNSGISWRLSKSEYNTVVGLRA
jgi:hypothetical protein